MQTRHHFRACCGEIAGILEIDRDASGNATSIKGISAEMLNWMAQALNITYECINEPIYTAENTSTRMGALHYVTELNKCDAIVGPIVFRYDRFLLMDFLHPWVTEPATLLIPMPALISDSEALIKPFTYPAWMAILGFIVVVVAMLMLLDYFKGPPGSSRRQLGTHWLAIIGSLFWQGGFSTSNKNRIRILMVAWLMGVFILNAYYTSQLFGYLMTNIPVPVVNSAEELADKAGIDLVVLSGWAPEKTITTSQFPLMKKLAKKLEENSTGSRCLTVADCIERVKTNKRPTAFIHQNGPISLGMMGDYRKTGQCNFALVQKSFDNYHQSWMIRKGDLYTEYYNRATMRMRESGLLNNWLQTYQPKPRKCLDMAKPQDDPRNPAVISLNNLAIPFLVLFAGCVLCFIVLICERGLAYASKKSNVAGAV